MAELWRFVVIILPVVMIVSAFYPMLRSINSDKGLSYKWGVWIAVWTTVTGVAVVIAASR